MMRAVSVDNVLTVEQEILNRLSIVAALRARRSLATPDHLVWVDRRIAEHETKITALRFGAAREVETP